MDRPPVANISYGVRKSSRRDPEEVSVRDPGKGGGRRDTWTPKNAVGRWGVGDPDGGASRGLAGEEGSAPRVRAFSHGCGSHEDSPHPRKTAWEELSVSLRFPAASWVSARHVP